jgi:hypothetical protein
VGRVEKARVSAHRRKCDSPSGKSGIRGDRFAHFADCGIGWRTGRVIAEWDCYNFRFGL